MEISQKLLCFLFLVSFAVGTALGGVYDLLYLSRMLLGFPRGRYPSSEKMRHGKLRKILCCGLLFLQDFLFALLGGICLILILYFINDGQFRFLAPLGLGCGFFVYRCTLGKLFLRISDILVRMIHRCLRFLWKCFKAPMRLLWRGIQKIVVQPVCGLISAHKYRQSLRYTQKVLADLKKAADNCFDADVERFD